jgi:ubiquinone/menaquinone biosynthesis C-methylase UbiE
MKREPRTTPSPAALAFDRVATSYDNLFTHTAIGRAQRKQVWPRLLAAFPQGSRILELNCGTGEDARFLAGQGRTVLACDASAAMVEVARGHALERDRKFVQSNLNYCHIANEDLRSLFVEKPFDGAFSNFSGFNCLTDLGTVASDLARLVRVDGRLLICLWSRCCVAEVMWFLAHGQLKKAVRRLSGKATARLGEMTISVRYPALREIRECFSPWFRLTSRKAVGLFVPPAYLERLISKRPKMLARLESLDRVCTAWPGLRDVGDHMLLEFVRCNP